MSASSPFAGDLGGGGLILPGLSPLMERLRRSCGGEGEGLVNRPWGEASGAGAPARASPSRVTRAEDALKPLMLAALDGDAAAYRTLLRSLRSPLRAYFERRLGRDPGEVEDLVQETLVALHTKRATYDPALPLSSWVYAIARYKLIDHYRRTGRAKKAPLEDADDVSTPDESAAADARRDVETGLAALSPRARDLVRRVKLQDEKVSDVAEEFGMSESAVKVAVHRGFMQMIKVLRGRSGDGEGGP